MLRPWFGSARVGDGRCLNCDLPFKNYGIERDSPGARLKDFHVPGVVYQGHVPGRHRYIGETGRCAILRIREHQSKWVRLVEETETVQFEWFIWPLSHGTEPARRYAYETRIINEARRNKKPGEVIHNSIAGRVGQGIRCDGCDFVLVSDDFPDTGSNTCKKCWSEKYRLHGRHCWICGETRLPKSFNRTCRNCEHLEGELWVSTCFSCRHHFNDEGYLSVCSGGDQPIWY